MPDNKIGTCYPSMLHILQTSPVIAYLLAGLSGLMFTFSNFLVQVVIESNPSQRIPTFEIVFARSAVQLVMLSPILLWSMTDLCVKKENISCLILLGIFGYLNLVFTYLALDKIPIVDVLVITFTSPFFCAIFSSCILKESVHWMDAVCGLVSFIGVILVAQPTFIFGTKENTKVVLFQSTLLSRHSKELIYFLGVLFALLGGICLAFYFVLTRKFTANGNHQLLTIVYPSLFGAVCSPIMMYLRRESFIIPETTYSKLFTITVGVSSCVALGFLTTSLKLENATNVNLVRNLDIVYAFLLQYSVMGIKPTMWKIIGGAIIVCATSLIVIRKWDIWENFFSKSTSDEDTDSLLMKP